MRCRPNKHIVAELFLFLTLVNYSNRGPRARVQERNTLPRDQGKCKSLRGGLAGKPPSSWFTLCSLAVSPPPQVLSWEAPCTHPGLPSTSRRWGALHAHSWWSAGPPAPCHMLACIGATFLRKNGCSEPDLPLQALFPGGERELQHPCTHLYPLPPLPVSQDRFQVLMLPIYFYSLVFFLD